MEDPGQSGFNTAICFTICIDAIKRIFLCDRNVDGIAEPLSGGTEG